MRSLTSIFFFHCAVAVGFADGVEDGFHFGVDFGRGRLVAEFDAGLDQRGVFFDGEAGVGFDVAEDPAFALGDGLVAELLRLRLRSPTRGMRLR
jgi:hypothetical protein